MKKRVLRVRDGNLIPMGNNFAYVLGDHPNKTDDVDIGPNNKNGLSVNHGEIMQFNRNGIRVFSAEPILGGISPSQLVQAGINPNTVFAAQERYKDIHHLKDDGRHAKLGDWITKYNNNTPINKDYAVIPLQGNPLYDITGTTKYKSTSSNNPESRKFVLDSLWAMENPYGQGLNRDGTYSPYGDPNGSDQDVGPGILLSNLPVKNSYTKQELEDYAYNKVLEGRDKIRQSFDEKYGQGEYDKLDDARKYIMDDVRYRAGKLAQSKWPKFYQAVYDNDVEKLLTESRTEFKDSTDRVIGWDNGRVERLAQYFYPDVIVEHKGNKNTYLKVYKKK